MKMRVVFMGTPEFAATPLKMLIKEQTDIRAVVTQPDRPVGRRRIITPPPVKTLALQYDIPVYQPEKVKEEEFISTLASLKPDIITVIAHVSEYFVLGALVTNAMKTSKVPRFKVFIFSVLICVFYAISDEVHQLFVPGRGAQMMDVLIDSAGAIAGIGCIFLIKRRNSTPYVE
jgi:VanZ family protein